MKTDHPRCTTVYEEVTTYSREAPEGKTRYNVRCDGHLYRCEICGAVRFCGREGCCLDRDQPSHWVQRRFNIESDFEGNGAYGTGLVGWTRGERWNGWQCPRFEKDAALAVIAFNNNAAARSTAWYDAEADAMVVQWEDDDEQRYEAEQIETSDGIKTVYAIGAGVWIWQAEEENAAARRSR